MNKIWFQDDLGESVSRPRVYNFLDPYVTYVEGAKLQREIVPFLRTCNQPIEIVDPRNYAAVQAIYVENKNSIYAKSDYRKLSGHSSGY